MIQRLPRLATVLVALVLSLAVVVGPKGGTANAFVGIPVPLVVAETLASPAGVVISRGAGMGICAGTVVCGAIVGGAMIGTALYATRDTWLPVVEGLFSRGRSGEGAANTRPCHGTSRLSGGGRTVSYTYSAGGSCAGSFIMTLVYSVKCYSTATGGVANYTGTTGVSASGGTNTATVSLCPVGTTVLSANVESVEFGATFFSPGITPAQTVVTTEIVCALAGGGTATIEGTISGRGDRFPVPSCQAAYPGSVPVRMDSKAGVALAQEPVVEMDLNDPRTEYPDCFDAGGHFIATACKVRVWVDGAPCHIGVPVCAAWYSRSLDDPGAVQCKWGSYVIPMPNCDSLRRQYRPDAQEMEVTEADPDTGEIGPKTTPDAPPKTPTEGPNPGAPPTTPTETTDPDSQNCFGDAWSMNPVSWVYVPVKCALLWAFKPKVSLQTRVEGVKTAFNNKVPFKWMASLGALPTAIPTGQCPDWHIKVLTMDKDIVCGSEFTQKITSARPWLAVGMIALAFMPLIRGLMYASVPLLKPTPTDSK